jgi:hypothetical protein
MNPGKKNAIKSFVFTYFFLNYIYNNNVAQNFPEKLTELTKKMMDINLEFKLSEIDRRFEDIIYDIESALISKTDFEIVKMEYDEFIRSYIS